MNRRWPKHIIAALMLGAALSGCSRPGRIRWDDPLASPRGSLSRTDDCAVRAVSAETAKDDEPANTTIPVLHLTGAAGSNRDLQAGAIPVEACIRRVLETNPMVRAARFNVEA